MRTAKRPQTFLQQRREGLRDLKPYYIGVSDWVEVQLSGDSVPACMQRGWKVLDIHQRALMTAIVMTTIRKARRQSTGGRS